MVRVWTCAERQDTNGIIFSVVPRVHKTTHEHFLINGLPSPPAFDDSFATVPGPNEFSLCVAVAPSSSSPQTPNRSDPT
jgi:hypothetical protein